MIAIPDHTQAKSFREIVASLPTIHHAWLLIDILSCSQGEEQIAVDLLYDTVYAREGVLEEYLQTLANYGLVCICPSNSRKELRSMETDQSTFA